MKRELQRMQTRTNQRITKISNDLNRLSWRTQSTLTKLAAKQVSAVTARR